MRFIAFLSFLLFQTHLQIVGGAPYDPALSPPLNPAHHPTPNYVNPISLNPPNLTSLSNNTSFINGTALGVDCQDITILKPECWELLNLTGFVQDYWANNSDECGQIFNGSFARCFMASLHFPGQDCTGIKPSSCTSSFSSMPNLSPEEYYVAWNIFAIASFFTNYWQALDSAGGLASQHIAAIVELINPPAAVNTPTADVLLAISAAFSFIVLDVKPIEKSIQACPTVGRCIFPAGSADSRFMQLGQIDSQLADLINGYQHNVSDAVANIENNVDNFIAFASPGSFNRDVISIQNQSDNILQGLTTFVIAEAFKANNIVVTRAQGVNPLEWQKAYDNSSITLPYDLKCTSYDEAGMCGPWWWDPDTQTSYSLDYLNHMDKDPSSVLETIFGNWTTPKLFFAGAARCHDHISTPNPPPLYNVSTGLISTSKWRRDGTETPGTIESIDSNGIETDCLSSVTVCTYDQSCTPSVDCEFTDCPTQSGYGVNGCPGNAEGSFETMNVPYGYLGPLLTEGGADTIVCRQF